MNSINDEFANIEEVLHTAFSGHNRYNYYAFALSRSRNERPTPKAFELTLQLVYSQDMKWMEVLERLAVNDYELAFSVCRDFPIVYPMLIHLAHPTSNQQILLFLQNKIFELLPNRNSDLRTMWCSFAELVSRYCQIPEQKHMINLLNRLQSTLSSNPNFFDSVDEVHGVSTEKGLENSIYSITSHKIILSLGRLFKACCKIFRKNMNYLQTNASLTNVIAWMQKKYEEIFNKDVAFCEKKECSSNYIENLLDCLVELEQFVELEDLSAHYCQNIARILLQWGLLQNNANDTEDQLNWEYGLIYKEFGKDLPSFIARTTAILASSLPGFLRTYINQLNALSLPIGEVIMRIAIVHKQLLARPDLIQSFLESFLQGIISSLNIYSQDAQSQLIFCRKIRLLILFSEMLKEKYLQKIVELALEMVRHEQYTSFCFLQGYNILKQVNAGSKNGQKILSRSAQILKQEVVPIINGLLSIVAQVYEKYPVDTQSAEREGKLNSVYSLLQEFLSQNQQVLSNMVPDILKRICEWTIEQAYSSWRKVRRSSTSVLNILIRLSKLTVMLVNDSYYFDLSTPIYSLLQLLINHNVRNYEDDLLEILAFVINLQKRVSPQLCGVVVELRRIVQKNQSLYCVRGVIKALCGKQVAGNVLYDLPDLCLFFFNLFVGYINHNNQNYIDYYTKEWQEVLALFGTYIQAYEAYLEQNQEAVNNILFCLQTIRQPELQLQLFLIMDHLKPVQHYQFYNFEKAVTFTRRSTFKLLFLHYCNQLRRGYHESLLAELSKLHGIYQQKQQRRAFQNEIYQDWPCLTTKSEVYIGQMLKQLRRRGDIDAMELNMHRRQFGLII